MKLCIPTLCRYDLLDRLLLSAESGSLTPSEYVILDNGGGYERARLDALLGARKEAARLIQPGVNLGVAASWNRFLELAGDETVVISNDDIVLSRDTFAELVRASREHAFVGAAGGWALFAQSAECTRRVGHYDENFWPAYYEDCDYLLRLWRAGIGVHTFPHHVHHDGEATTPAYANAELIHEGRLRNYAYFVAKWGAESPRWHDTPVTGHYAEIWNGAPPPGWHERSRVPNAAPLRWDILNGIARRIGAKRYLELGAADGSCLRRVEVEERWGVDVKPQPGAVRAASVLVPHTTDRFFEQIAGRAGKFDLVFIDADHRAEQVYREVEHSLRLLAPGGVIVLHDSNPHDEAMQEVPEPSRGYQWTGDVWKAIVRLRAEGRHSVRVVRSDFGVAILIPDVPGDRLESTPDLAQLRYADLARFRDDWLGLLPGWEWEAWFERTYARRGATRASLAVA